MFKGAEREGADMTLGDHLRELRYRLLICAGAIFLFMLPAWFLYPWLIEVLNAPYCNALRGVDPGSDCNFLVTNLLDPFSLRLKVAGYGGRVPGHADPVVAAVAVHRTRPLQEGAPLRARLHPLGVRVCSWPVPRWPTSP